MADIPARSLVTICVNIAITAVCLPAFADSASTGAGATKPKQTTSSGSRSWPIRIAGVLIGSVVGTPVNAIRKTIDEEKYGIQGMVGDSDSKFKKVAAGTFWLPFSVLLGTAECPASATMNALRENDKPFSKSQFAISDCKKEVSKDSIPTPKDSIPTPKDSSP